MEGKRVDTESTIDDLCSRDAVRLGLFFPFGIQWFVGKLMRGGEVPPSVIVPGQVRRALTLTHAGGTVVLHYPDAVVIFDEAPYAGHYGFDFAREGQLGEYHLVPR